MSAFETLYTGPIPLRRCRDEDRQAFAAMKPELCNSCRVASGSNASTWIAVDRTRYLSVASVFHQVQPINHLAPLVTFIKSSQSITSRRW
jgi:hypothetical protein